MHHHLLRSHGGAAAYLRGKGTVVRAWRSLVLRLPPSYAALLSQEAGPPRSPPRGLGWLWMERGPAGARAGRAMEPLCCDTRRLASCSVAAASRAAATAARSSRASPATRERCVVSAAAAAAAASCCACAGCGATVRTMVRTMADPGAWVDIAWHLVMVVVRASVSIAQAWQFGRERDSRGSQLITRSAAL